MRDKLPAEPAAAKRAGAKAAAEAVVVAEKGTAGIGVLEKAMALLNIVSKAPAPMTFTQLLHACGMPRATLHRILATLQREGLLQHDAGSKTFRLGLRFLELAHEVWSDFDLRVAAQDELLLLRDQTGESVHLVVLEGLSAVVIAGEQARQSVRLAPGVGERLPLHASAVGKAMMAWLDTSQQQQLLESITLPPLGPRTLTSIVALRSELDLTRSRGYAIAVCESSPDTVALAAPVFDFEQRPVGAVAISGKLAELDETRAHSLSAAVIGAARKISHNAGGRSMSISSKGQPEAQSNTEVRCVSQVPSLLGEGPLWSPRDDALYWVDILTPAIHRFDVATGKDTETKLGSMVSLVIPKATGGLLIATPNGLMTIDDSGTQTRLSHPESDRPGNRYNDGKCDRMGRLWVGTMDMGAAPNRGNLFKVEADGAWRKMDTGFTVANGLGWSPDNTRMYFTDSHRKLVFQYDFDFISGTIDNRRPLISFDASAGSPDGLTVDAEGCLWVAMWDEWCVARFDPEGREMTRIRMPVPRPTSCCFGGPNLDVLYVTSARVRLAQDVLKSAPLSGSLFAIQMPGVRGLPETIFAG
ncbi:SMP-30/gluconolactonase/LRE family protein [Paraburkholderia sp. C35]|uniref:SMP-30/gluconolactonase/LRE family protein n=1 Tax=Paraburkholderia sp. C35 TaxID=2126993 RepID=UPI001EF55347|nr:SMP-30/gluconolactonase/LRE family protein [Paraburkholderia sp. C35]